MRTPEDWFNLYSFLGQRSGELLGKDWQQKDHAWSAMLRDTPLRNACWWDGIAPSNDEESALLAQAAWAFANREPLPPLSEPTLARFSFRLLMAGAFCRAMSHKHHPAASGWLPEKLSAMKQDDVVFWLLHDGWPFLEEIATSALQWAGSIPRQP
jgi:hypothetical protein